MQLDGQHVFPAPAARVWALLMDPAALSSCLPGCQRFERTEPPAASGPVAPDAPEIYDVTLQIGVANIKGVYRGKVRVTDKVPGQRYVLGVEGDGAQGFVRGQATIVLRQEVPSSELKVPGQGTPNSEPGTRNPEPQTRTVVTYRGEAQVGGTIAAVGQRLLSATARTLVSQFFNCLGQRLSTASEE